LQAWVSERFGRGARDARPDDGVDGSAASGESQPPKIGIKSLSYREQKIFKKKENE
ncbi:hypothetical protein Tco_0685285, partial [Tanacetum coccineum]